MNAEWLSDRDIEAYEDKGKRPRGQETKGLRSQRDRGAEELKRQGVGKTKIPRILF